MFGVDFDVMLINRVGGREKQRLGKGGRNEMGLVDLGDCMICGYYEQDVVLL